LKLETYLTLNSVHSILKRVGKRMASYKMKSKYLMQLGPLNILMLPVLIHLEDHRVLVESF